MKIVCSKCGIIHDANFAPCKSTLSLPPAEDAPRRITQERAFAVAAGAGLAWRGNAEPERAGTALAAPDLPPEGRSTIELPVTAPAEPAWRREVTERLEKYRARRGRYRPLDVRRDRDDSQPFLALAPPIADASPSQAAEAEDVDSGNGQNGGNGNGHATAHEGGNGHSFSQAGGNGRANEASRGLPRVEFAAPESPGDADEYVRRRAALRIAARPRSQERVEIAVAQPQFDFSVNQAPELHPQDQQRPVAELRERRLAGMVDAAILGVTCVGFFLLFRALGGELSLSRFSVAACLASTYLVYAQYFVLFTVFTGVTPGMMLRGLEVLTLDGGTPSTRHLLWRSFGYLISAAAGFLGFLWAGWDDDHLTWQDRISQTYVTPATEEASEELVASLQES